MSVPASLTDRTVTHRSSDGNPDLRYLSQLAGRVRFVEHQWILREGHGPSWDVGGCAVVSEVLDLRYGWERWGGCYIDSVGDHIAHYWNRLPDGRIIDATADQFDDAALDPFYGSVTVGRARVALADDNRYDPTCEGDWCGGVF